MLAQLQLDAVLTSWLTQQQALLVFVHILGITCFAYIITRRMVPLARAQRDPRFDRPAARMANLLKFWLGQWKHPRYEAAGTLHILIFGGFILLAARAFTVLIVGVFPDFVMPGLAGTAGTMYEAVTDYAATVVFLCMLFAITRRLVFRPARYGVPSRFGKAHSADAIFLLALIAALMLADSLFEGAKLAALAPHGESSLATVLSLPWIFKTALASVPLPALARVYAGSYLLHAIIFYFLLCYRPFGIQFHVETSLFNIYFAKLDRELLKPVRWGVNDDQLDQLKSWGVKTFEDFTWKHVLDFYSCADCGRCSDNCPANAVGRALSPRFLSIKARDYAFRHYPMFGHVGNGKPLIGTIYSEDEIWSCTTCGACEAECPLLVEYIDKIVDLRRGMVDDGKVPQSLQKPLKSLESRGNPYGKLEKKRAEWASAAGWPQGPQVKTLDKRSGAGTLYFVDSVTSYDARMQAIARATAKILSHLQENFGILGPAESDSGHEVRRFGEETLFQALRARNLNAIAACGAKRIVTADPHAYNALKHDYPDAPPVEHISQVLAAAVRSGKLHFDPVENGSDVYAYHDPCYLGRHNQIYEEPREVLDAIPRLQRVEMSRCRDRSFCCGGGGLMLFYEPQEEQRMGVKRVRMAAEAGANVIVTACPFCLTNIEDAIKVAGMEGKMTAVDLAELAARQIAPQAASCGRPEAALQPANTTER
jgi:Fe-S oxidoreductase